MGLFDAVREKAAELLSGAGDKVSELTGAELPNANEVTDQLPQADQVAESAQGVTDTVTESATDTVTGAVDGVTDTVAENVEPYRP
jgi:hypothetical protein